MSAVRSYRAAAAGSQTHSSAGRIVRLSQSEADQHRENASRFEELVRDYKAQVQGQLGELADKESETTRLRSQLEFQVRHGAMLVPGCRNRLS